MKTLLKTGLRLAAKAAAPCLLAALAALAGCGGSSSDDPADESGAPVPTPRVDCVARPDLCK